MTPRRVRITGRSDRRPWWLTPLLTVCLVVLASRATHAYIGPGAGFALLSSFFVLFATILGVIASILAWPFRAAWRMLRGRRRIPTGVRRVIIVGFSGQDPALTEQFMREGRLPHFQALAESGVYRRLRTTNPAADPVAWSSFSTGCLPARHNIFDEVEPDRRSYEPVLSSVRRSGERRSLRFGRYRLPLGRSEVRSQRMAKPFWTILGEHHIWSTVLRVPASFPPDRFHGAQLSATCVPDLLGSQGTFLWFTTRAAATPLEGGTRIPLPPGRDLIDTVVPGPENLYVAAGGRLTSPLRLILDRPNRCVRAELDGVTLDLTPGLLTEWISLRFRAAPGVSLRGLARLLVTEMADHVSLYMTPIHLDPERPDVPISHPGYYSTYLAKRIGAFATLGAAEDALALDAGVIDDAAFLMQTYDVDREREAQFNAALGRLDTGSLVCVFDATDRVQHMFWRDIDPDHPAGRGRQDTAQPTVIREIYEHNDARLGRLLARIGRDDVLMVMSEHGCTSFRRGVNLNAWLLAAGYLALKPGADAGAAALGDVDWANTRAYALGLTGVFLNLRSREELGSVLPADAGAIKAELISRLTGLRDPDRGAVAIRHAYDAAALYRGPYQDRAPDIVIAYSAGYRASWSAARGGAGGAVFSDNMHAWSGDHAVDPALVPGVFFCNRPTGTEDPAIVDIAPTVLRLFGLEPPGDMDGRPMANLP